MKKLFLVKVMIFFTWLGIAKAQCPSGACLTSGTFIGQGVGTGGSFNAFFGLNAGRQTTGKGNAFFGFLSADANTTGFNNSFFGAQAGEKNTSGQNNSFFGRYAGTRNTEGSFNAFFGRSAGSNNTTGNDNAFFGMYAGQKNKTGSLNAYFGKEAGFSSTNGEQNAYFGAYAGRNNKTGANNAFFGFSAGLENSTGFANAFFGTYAGAGIHEGAGNSFIGYRAGQFSVDGYHNVFVGSAAGLSNLGSGNTFIGTQAGEGNISGSGNVFIGRSAGKDETGSQKLYIANNNGVKPLVYGEFDNRIFSVNGSLGVGIEQPERPIHLRAENAIFRIDRDRKDPGFAIVRYDEGFQNVWKSFYFYTLGTGVNQGKFIIADWGTQVRGESKARLVIANNGHVGIGNYLQNNPAQKLSVQGNILATGSFITSDKRFKKNIQAIGSASKHLEQIQGVRYAYQSEKFAEQGLPKGQFIGLIAQEVEQVYPELVAEDEKGYKSINYDGFIPVLIEAWKEQKVLLHAQEEKHRSEIAELRAELNQLKKSLSSSDEQEVNEASSQLFQNQPNPLDQSTRIPYHLSEEVGQALLMITDLQGKEVRRFGLTQKGAGEIQLDSQQLASGLYLYTLVVDGKIIDSKRMMIRH